MLFGNFGEIDTNVAKGGRPKHNLTTNYERRLSTQEKTISSLNHLKLVTVKKTTKYAPGYDSPHLVCNQVLGADQFGAKLAR